MTSRDGSSRLECRQKGRRQTTSEVRQIWEIRFFLDREGRSRDRALFDLERALGLARQIAAKEAR